MPRGVRRPPPSHLLLAPPGPVPRGKPKHKLPTIPLPTFQPAAHLPKATDQRMSYKQSTPVITDLITMMPPIEAYSAEGPSRRSEGEQSWLRSYEHHSASSSTSSLTSLASTCPSPSEVLLRGPWDYSRPIQIDVKNILAVPKQAAINP